MRNETFYEYGRYKDIENREDTLISFKKEVADSGIIEQLSDLASVYKEREEQGLFYNNDKDCSYIEIYTEKFKKIMSDPEASWKDIESAFGSIGYVLMRRCPGYDTKYSSSETTGSLGNLIDYFNELKEKIGLFRDIVENFENQNKMVKIEVKRCLMFAEEICKRLKKTSSLPYFSLTVPELKEKTKELDQCLDDLEKEAGPLEEDLLEEFASRQGSLLTHKECFFSDGSREGLLNPDDEIEIDISKSNKEEDEEEGRDFQGYEMRARNKRIAEEQPQAEFNGTISEGSNEDLKQFIKIMDIPTKEGRSIGYKGEAEAIISLKRKGHADDYKIIVARNEGKKIIGIAALESRDKKNAHITMLAVLPQYHSQGTGSAILSHIKSEYDSIDLSAIPKTSDSDHEYEYFSEKLDKFYKENGFVSAKEWHKDIVSMDDKNEAGKWHEINKGVEAFGLNNEYFYTNKVIEKLFSSLISNKDESSKFSPEIISDLEKWKEIYDEKMKTYKERESLNRIRRIKK
ncbi:MAG: GNAT family N-acetyltransferase [Candidatus Paceibacterota bacterium]|jgi:N-acetylglutamate synthase-like GNAT family acetyltransferase